MLGFGSLCQLPLCSLPDAGPSAVGGYGGVWMYGLEHWKRLRGEEEPKREVIEAVAEVVKRIPSEEDDIQARILLRLELERRGREWNQTYLDALEAYRIGVAEELANIRENERLRQDALAWEFAAMALRAAQYKRRLALILLLDS